MPGVLQLAALLVIAWLPGAAWFRAPIAERNRRERLDAEERLFWQVLLSLASALIIVLALASVGRYRFEYLVGAQLLLTAIPVLLWRERLRFSAAPRPALSALIPIALIVLCSLRFFPGAEYIIAGKDPGTYVNEGVQLAQRGAYVVHDEIVASVPPPFRDLFFSQHTLDGKPRTDYYSNRFMGFFLLDPAAGTVVGQFPHLFPAALAIGYGIDGLSGVRRVTPMLAILGLLAVYFAGRHVFGPTAAAAGAALLALNVVQIWFARYPNSEVLMQALVFASVLAVSRAQAGSDRFFSPVAGALLGALLFLRFDAVLVIAAVGAGVTLGILAGQRIVWGAAAALAALAVPAAVYLAGPLRAYAFYPLDFIGNMPWWQHVALLAVFAAAILLLAAASARPRLRQVVSSYAPLAIAAVCIIAALYALFLREPGGKLTDYNAYALRTFGNFYVTVPVVLAALLGYALGVRLAFWRSPAFFLLVAIFGFFFFYKLRIVPEHFWAARRFLPVLLPAALLLASVAAVGSIDLRGGRARLVRPLLGLIFLGLVAAHYVRVSAPVASHTEYAGLIPKVEELAAQFHDNDLVIVESRDAGGDTHVFGLPLAYIYARNVLVLNSARPPKATFAAFLQWAQGRYDRVLFMGGGGTDLLSHSYGVKPIWSDRYQVPEYQSAMNAFPRSVRQKEFEYGVYEFTPPVPRADRWFDLDVGTNDDLHVLRFRAKEPSEGRTFRWTGAASAISVTTMQPGAKELTLVMGDGGRPPAAPPATVEVFLAGERLGRIAVDGPFRPYTLAIPADLARKAATAAEPVELRLVTTLWNPAEVLGTQDDRELGVMLDRVTIK